MAQGEIQRIRNAIEAQIASESFLSMNATSAQISGALTVGNTNDSVLPHPFIAREFAAPSSISKDFTIVAHHESSLMQDYSSDAAIESGFSATLFRYKENEQDVYTLSFRSTEFARNIHDPGDIYADLEIGAYGWAFSQFLDMQNFWQYLIGDGEISGSHGITTNNSIALADFRDHVDTGGKLHVTGYSLGGNLAQAFTQLHSTHVDRTYLFNAAGTGFAISDLSSIWADYLAAYNDDELSQISNIPIALIGTTLHTARVFGGHFILPPNAGFLRFDHQRAMTAIENQVTGLNFTNPQRMRNGPSALITDIWASNGSDEDWFSTVVAETGNRHGKAQPIWHEEQLPAYWESLNRFGEHFGTWGTGHSIVLLQDSLSVMALFEQIQPDITIEQIGNWFESSSFNYYDSLERAANTLATLTGVERLNLSETQSADIEFANLDYRNLLHEKIYAIKDSELFKQLAELEPEEAAVFEGINLTTLATDARSDFSAFLALYQGSPFKLVHDDIESFYHQQGVHSQLHAAWLQDAEMSAEDRSRGKANFTEEFYADRLFFLSNFLSMANTNIQHGELTEKIKFSDLASQLVFDGDANGYFLEGAPIPVFGPDEYDDERARISFGTQNSDATANGSNLQVSNEDDHVYALAGNDLLNGLEGNDHLDGGDGNDDVRGDAGNDTVVGGNGNDYLYGGEGHDSLIGGRGNDQFHWMTGDGIETILDHDDGGDRVFIDGIDVATMNFQQLSPNGLYYVDQDHPGIVAVWYGEWLTLQIGNGADAGRIEMPHYLPADGSDFGITLSDFSEPELDVTDVVVIEVGRDEEQTDWEAWLRDVTDQGGIDWASSTITLDMNTTSNFSGNDRSPIFGSVRFDGGPLDDQLTGDALNQSLNGLGGDDFLQGLEGDDMLSGWQGSDTIHGGAGNDYLFGNTRYELNQSLEPTDFLYAFSEEETEDVNTMDGGSGHDLISGGERTDTAFGGPGSDYLWGGAGGDNLYGGADHDVILGDSSLGFEYELDEAESMVYANARTAFVSNAELDSFYDDIIHGGNGNDYIWGEVGDDLIYGGAGIDYLVGDREASAAFANSPLIPFGSTMYDLDDIEHGNDELYGGGDNDQLFGLGGNDLLAGGAGDDQLRGGKGDDAYLYSAGDGTDTITDDEGQHTLVFQGVQAESLVASFQGEQVHVGLRNNPGGGGFMLARDQWSNASIAINSSDNVVDRARLEQNYFNASDELVFSISGSRGVSDADRDALVSVDDSNTERPVFNLGGGARSLEIIANYYGPDAHLFRISNLEDFSGNFGAPSSVDIEQRIASGDWDSLDWLDLVGVRVKTVGVSNIQCGILDDHVIGTDGADKIYGLGGSDILEGLGGNDELYGGTGSNILIGGKGDDYLAGGTSAVYEFYAGDGHDQLDTPIRADLSFNGIDAQGIELVYTGDQNTTFDIVTGSGNRITAAGATNIGVLTSLSVDGHKVPVVQTSNLTDGTFYSSRLDDIFEVGAGSDIIHADAWGSNTYRFSYGDGNDTIIEDSPFSREYHGDIEFGSNVDFEDIRFRFDRFSGDAWISYGSDEIHLDGGDLYDNWHNPLALFNITSSGNPSAVPVIRPADDYTGPWLYGSYGTDHIISGDSGHTIRPGYGNDLIEAGGGDDQIRLSDHYLYEPGHQRDGIGRKRIIGGTGNDLIMAPLHQGLTFVYGLGDGNDTLKYDWSYDEHDDRYVYLINIDPNEQTVGYTARGEDTLELGPGLAIDDLDFTRIGDHLEIYVRGGNGSLMIENFFVAYQVDATGVSTAELFQWEGFAPHALTHPAILAAMPDLPISHIQLANGQSVSMQEILNQRMVELDVPDDLTFLGTPQADVLTGTSATGDTIIARQGDDTISVGNGSNYIDAGSGNDQLNISGGINTVYAGTGDDTITLHDGTSVIEAGDGFDYVSIHGGSNTVYTGNGDDTVFLTDGSSFIDGGAGFDYIVVDGGQHHISGGDDFNFLELRGGENQIHVGDGSDAVIVTGGTHRITRYGAGSGLASVAVATGSGATLILEMAAGLRADEVAISQINNEAGYSILVEVSSGNGGQVFSTLAIDPFNAIATSQAGSALNSIVFDDGTVLQQHDIVALAAANQLLEVTGTSSNDTLTGGSARDAIQGASGDDTISGGAGNDLIDGGEGNDLIEGGEGNDVLLGGAGNDTFIYHGTNSGFDTINGGDGFDIVLGGPQNDLIGIAGSLLDASIEKIDGGGGNFNVIVGDSGDNILDFSTTELANILAVTGAGGNDIIIGSDQNNILVGAQGNDILTGGMGNDILIGDTGDDTFTVAGTQSGFDLITGGEGFDTLLGSSDNDLFGLSSLNISDKLERIDGGSGVFDVIIGDGNANTLDFTATELLNILAIVGGAGNDSIIGSSTDDFLIGGLGDDALTGGAGTDTLRGEAGDDNLIGSLGNDIVNGGAGSDRYWFAEGDGADLLQNNDSDLGSIDRAMFQDTQFDALWFSRSQDSLLVDVIGTNDSVTLENWYSDNASKIDEFHAGGRVLHRNQIDQLVSAMSTFDVPVGVGAVMAQDTRLQLEPTLTTVWQAA